MMEDQRSTELQLAAVSSTLAQLRASARLERRQIVEQCGMAAWYQLTGNRRKTRLDRLCEAVAAWRYELAQRIDMSA